MGQGCESGTQLCVEAQNSTQVHSPATGDLKNTPNHHFLPDVDFRPTVRPGCQIRQLRSGGAEVGDLGRLIGDQGEINDSESDMPG